MISITLLNQLLPEAVLVLTALVVLGVSLTMQSRSGKPTAYATVSWIAVVGVVIAGLSMLGQDQSMGQVYLITMNPLSTVLKLLVLGLGALALLLPPARDEIRHSGEYVALMLFAICGLLLAVGTNHLLMLFVALELSSLSLYLLVGFPRTAAASEVSLKYFLFGGVSAAFTLFGISLIYGAFHQLGLMEIQQQLSQVGSMPMLAVAGLVMVVVGLGFKMAAAPFHYWAPDVYQGAPATTVALISAASKVVGLAILIRLLVFGFGAGAGAAAWGGMTAGWAIWVAVLAAVSMLFGNLVALAQTSVRRLLAYSAVANTGYLLVGISANREDAAGTALFYVVVYGLATMGALAITAAVERSRGSDHREAFAGLIQRSPCLAVALLICLASLAGIPPLAGFVGKFAMFSKALVGPTANSHSGLFWLVALGAAMSAVSLYYYLSVVKQAFVKSDAEGAATDPALPLAHRLAIGIPVAGVVVLGLCPSMLMKVIMAAL